MVAASTVSWPPAGRSAVSQPVGDHARRLAEPAEARAHGRGGFDGGPGQRGIGERRAELAATGADIEQPADLGHGAADQRRHAAT